MNRYRALLEQEVVGVALIANDSGRFRRVNAKFCELTGYSEQELADRTLRQLGCPQRMRGSGSSDPHADVDQLIAGATELCLVRKDGAAIWLRLSVSGAEQESDFDFRILIAQDISERKRAEDQLRAQGQQQAAVADLGLFALQTYSSRELIDRAVQTISEMLAVATVQVLELTDRGQRLRRLNGWGLADGAQRGMNGYFRVDSLWRFTFARTSPVVVDDLARDSRFQPPFELLDRGVVSGIHAVIHHQQQPFGALAVYTQDRREFETHEVRFVQSVANVLAYGLRMRATDEERRKLISLIENNQDFVGLLTLDGRLDYLNPSGLEIARLPDSASVCGKRIQDFMSPDGDRWLAKTVLPALLSTGTWSGEHQLRTHATNENVPVEIDAFLLPESSTGEATGVGVIARDLRDRRAAEVELRRTKFAVDQSGASFTRIRADGRFDYVNESAAKILGYTPNEVLHKHVWDVAPEVSRESWQAAWESFRQNSVTTFMSRGQRRDGESYAVEVTATYHQTADDEFVFALATDVTDRCDAEAQLRASEEKFRMLSERSPALVVIVQNERLVYCNATACTLVEYSADELHDMPFREIVHPDDFETISRRHHERLAGERVTSRYDARIVTKAGEIRWVDLSAEAIDYDGRPAVLVICVDVTERLENERRHRERESQLAHVSRLSTMGEMVAGIAHEINQPLSAITNFASAVRNTLEAMPPQEHALVDQWLRQITQQAVRCGDIIRQLRGFVNKDDERRRTVDLRQTIEDSLALVRHAARRRPCPIACELPEEALLVYANDVQLQQVFVNLLCNAIEAVHDQAQPEITIRLEATRATAKLTVVDNGPGVDQQMRDHLFDAFYTTKPNGMGMGLAISKSIVDSHFGRLGWEETTAGGTAFYVELPRRSGIQA